MKRKDDGAGILACQFAGRYARSVYNNDMELIAIQTPTLRPGDNLAAMFLKQGKILPGDIIAVSSKAVATVEGRTIEYKTITPGPEAKRQAKLSGQSPQFCQAILEETKRLNGRVLPGCPQAMLTELCPDGFPEGVLLAANAGLDESNAPKGFCIGWPEDPVKSIRRLRKELGEAVRTKTTTTKTKRDSSSSFSSSSSSIGLLITDSTCRPRRFGVTALALTVSGFDPLRSLVGTKDLFNKSLRMTQEAVADQLATAANMLMGNAGESVPAVIMRDHGISFTDFEGWVPGIEAEADLFRGL